jgi:hypothetical protein
MNKKSKIRDIPKQAIESAVSKSSSYRETCRRLNLNDSGNQYNILIDCVKRYSISTCHFDAHKTKRKPDNLAFASNSKYGRKNLVRRLIKENLIPNENCAICNIGREWNGQKLVLHIDHINGINNDNRLENLRFLCPNCHSQTETYGARNKIKC